MAPATLSIQTIDPAGVSARINRTEPRGVYIAFSLWLLGFSFLPLPSWFVFAMLVPGVILLFMFQRTEQLVTFSKDRMFVQNRAGPFKWSTGYELALVEQVQFEEPADVFWALIRGGVTFSYNKKKKILGIGLSEHDGKKLVAEIAAALPQV